MSEELETVHYSQPTRLHCPMCGATPVVIDNVSMFQRQPDNRVHFFRILRGVGCSQADVTEKMGEQVASLFIHMSSPECGHKWNVIYRTESEVAGTAVMEQGVTAATDPTDMATNLNDPPAPSAGPHNVHPIIASLIQGLSAAMGGSVGHIIHVEGGGPVKVPGSKLVFKQEKDYQAKPTVAKPPPAVTNPNSVEDVWRSFLATLAIERPLLLQWLEVAVPATIGRINDGPPTLVVNYQGKHATLAKAFSLPANLAAAEQILTRVMNQPDAHIRVLVEGSPLS